MIERKCQNCGAPLRETDFGRYTCDYCGSRYETRGGMELYRIVEVDHRKSERLAAEVSIPFAAREHMGAEEIGRYAMKFMANSMAEKIAEYMKLTIQEDPMRMATIIMGELRVIPPDERLRYL